MQRLDPLVGELTMDAAGVSGRVSFGWLEGRRFFIQRWSVDAPLPPDGIAIIGADPRAAGSCSTTSTRAASTGPTP